MEKFSGILLPVSCLHSPYGIGSFSKEAYDFVIWLKNAGQSYWQILPLGPTGYGDSPYQSFSVFAGNPYFIDIDELVNDGVITEKECKNADFGDDSGQVNYEKLYRNRYSLLKKAYKRSNCAADEKYIDFVRENCDWLEDYALFMAVKDHFGGIPFTEWKRDIRNRDDAAVLRYSELLTEEVGFHKYLQYKFYSGWNRLKAFANENGVKIIGDIPIYTSSDSCDVWKWRELFDVDSDGVPNMVAGCPPDGFSADGQLWGNPLYRWSEHKKDGYRWWMKRLKHCFKMYDGVRIDHFRAFDEYYAIPKGERTARNGKWLKSPGRELFAEFEKIYPDGEIIAEDLGFITESVKKLVADCGFCGMKVLQFAFDSRDTGCAVDYLPHNYPYNCAAYTGTHDNATLKGWLRDIPKEDKESLRAYLCDYTSGDDELIDSIISLIMRSGAKYAIIPIQDWLGLGNEARINTPSTLGGNWTWRIKGDELSSELAKKILKLTKQFGRI